jgi:hypothetical protein
VRRLPPWVMELHKECFPPSVPANERATVVDGISDEKDDGGSAAADTPKRVAGEEGAGVSGAKLFESTLPHHIQFKCIDNQVSFHSCTTP